MGSAYIHNTVQGQLAAQQITFPPASAFAHAKAGTEITPSMIPSVSQYAGQQLLTGQQAEAYADHFIAVHISEMGAGKTYSQLSAESLAQPANTALAATVGTVFKGETLRSMLLNAYGWWKVSQITYIASLVMFGLGTLAALGGAFRVRPDPPRAPRPVTVTSAPAVEQITRPATRPAPPPKAATLTATPAIRTRRASRPGLPAEREARCNGTTQDARRSGVRRATRVRWRAPRPATAPASCCSCVTG